MKKILLLIILILLMFGCSNMLGDVIAPIPGNGGHIDSTPVSTDTGIVISWDPATDDTPESAGVTYEVFISDQDNIGTLNDIADNGTSIGVYPDGTDSAEISGVAPGDYFVVVVVTDPSGNSTVYESTPVFIEDNTAPVPGQGGENAGTDAVAVDGITNTGGNISWDPADDNGTDESQLQYLVVISTSDSVNTVEEANVTYPGNGTVTILQDWTAGLTDISISSLDPDTDYWINILVQDENGNVAIYSSTSFTTDSNADTTAPTAGGGSGTAITVGSLSVSGGNASWNASTDNTSAAANLEYKVVVSETASEVAADATGAIVQQDWTANITSDVLSGLTASTNYYINVFVRDEAGNVAPYTQNSFTTFTAPDTAAPTAGSGSGTAITVGSLSVSGGNASWNASTDNTSAAANLEYKVVVSETASEVAADATGAIVQQDWTANITSDVLSGLTASTTYYINVFVRDEAGNVAPYTQNSFTTLTTPDTTAPTAGGGSGTVITVGSLSVSGGNASWNASTDNTSAAANLEYKVVVSETASEVAADATGAIVQQDWTANITSDVLSGLTASTTYYINVFVRDEAGNVAQYTQSSFTTLTAPDTTAPTAGGGSGTVITVGSLSVSGGNASWNASTDNTSTAANLEYKVVVSATASEVAADATGAIVQQDWTANITSDVLSGLTASTTYYINVFVRDEAGNVAQYTQSSFTTADGTAPTAGGGSGTAITVGSLSVSGGNASWNASTDNTSAAANLEYKVVVSETASEVAADATGAIVQQDWTANITSDLLSGLTGSTTYYINVFVRDEAGNVAQYTQSSFTTADGTAPTAGGGSGTAITVGSLSVSGGNASWNASTDNTSTAASLEYKVVVSATASEVAADATGAIVQQDWTANITSDVLSGLTASTTYYINVFVRDEAGNVAQYTQSSFTTADGIAPTAGGGSGTAITVGSLSVSGGNASWNASTDNTSAAVNLEYKVVVSETASEVAADATGAIVQQDWTANITSDVLSGLTGSSTYYINVFVRDEAGNVAQYTQSSFTTADGTAPTAGGGSGTVITVGSLSVSGGNASWNASTDNTSAAANLEYKVVVSETASEVAADATGSIVQQDWTANITSDVLSGLTGSTTYYINVFVRDEAGNVAPYTQSSFTTTVSSDVTVEIESNQPDDEPVTITYSVGGSTAAELGQNAVFSATDVITLSLEESFDNYRWVVGGNTAETSNAFVLDLATLGSGKHRITLVVGKDVNGRTEYYARSFTFVIQ